ncbi:hypothetical protein [uncultured Psychroserpens sp.]|uniref:hypothetical protein n=1 Tax=uncultured Psychroserpens sp. TaxID=255436 RepID=UPI00260DF1F5|nr:hypothetical protein [uncultured Psychroserpens sp.]
MKEPEKKSGFNCPNCNFFIEVTLKSLLYAKSQDCPGCLTKFEMDRQESSRALNLMQNLNTVIDNIESVKDFSPENYKG